ncbi:efflux RND transporter periplasmic adaptor subunit [Shewanella litorisediminis]|uniref:Efflux RND transporter periplasmic adaptor subunit n=1 Tax=Shewanella litorisediminis TaxID=1173586 RepID=A0ABX7G301_9GAMM|nr:efflux RND transporter periplasmic adaptor subunit [Shewanella litorisediminis]
MNTKKQKSALLLIGASLAFGPGMPAMVLAESPQQSPASEATEAAIYHCPMHPEVESHEPGRCPKCKMFLVPGAGASAQSGEPLVAAHKTYICPMHPEVESHEPSRCPKCKMFLVEKEEEEESEPQAEQKGAADNSAHQSAPKDIFAKPAANPIDGGTVKYVCPMHAHIISDEPGSCPICGMDLEKVELGGGQEVQVDVSGSMQQALALRVAKAERQTLWKFVDTVGQIEYDERQIHHVHARLNGWIETLKVNAVGDKVSKGQLLYEIYSPDLVNAQDDYLLAIDTVKKAGESGRYKELLRKANLRLELLGMTQAQIKELARTQTTQYRVPFYARQDGVITTLNTREGMYIQPMSEILALTDISKVWVIADVFENEQSWLKVGQSAEVAVPAMGLSGIEGTIDYIYPELDPVTRSLRVRVVLDNPDQQLRPNTLAKVKLYGGPKRDILTIPQEALIQTGKENRVIVRTADNSFAARQVTVGMYSQGKVEVLSGLSDGEEVVTSGQFLLDSEASLKGSLMRLGSGHQH